MSASLLQPPTFKTVAMTNTPSKILKLVFVLFIAKYRYRLDELQQHLASEDPGAWTLNGSKR